MWEKRNLINQGDFSKPVSSLLPFRGVTKKKSRLFVIQAGHEIYELNYSIA